MGLLFGVRRALLRGANPTYVDEVLSSNPIAYWPMWETAGVVAECLVDSAQNGTYNGPTLANATAPDGSPCPYFDGVNDVIDIYSTTFRDAFNGDTGSLMYWMRMAVGGWTDGVSRRPLMFRENGWNNYVGFLKPAAPGSLLQAYYRAGAVSDIVPYNTSRTGWINVIFTWDRPGDEAILYIDGTNIGSAGTLGVWGGTLGPTTTIIGAVSTTGADWWKGWLAHVVVWDRVLT